MKKYFNSILVLSLGSLMFLFSCERYLAVEPPNNRLSTAAVYADSAAASLALVGVYSNMVGSALGYITMQQSLWSLCADDMNYSGTSVQIRQFLDNSILIDNGNLNTLWGNLYRHIYQVNAVIEGVEASQGIAQGAKQLFLGEAKFIRAFLLFNAVNSWGDIPLITSTDYRVNEAKPRTSATAVYEQIVADLQAAVDGLQDRYVGSERARPNRVTALALLARVELYRRNWERAEELATALIDRTDYRLEANLNAVFLKDSREVIWQLAPSTTIPTNTPASDYVPASFTDAVIPLYLLYPEFYAGFAEQDRRRQDWIAIKPAGPYYVFYKYKDRSMPMATRREYTVLFRLAEQYLIRAEARAQRGNVQAAVNDLNSIRARAQAPRLTTSFTQEQLLQAVERERQQELFNDWGGHRWLDLKRTGRANAVLGALKGPNWQPEDQLWPIPLQQLLTNPFLTQNAGY